MAAKPIARRHHFLSQTYLAAFTDTGLKDGQFKVLDVQTGNVFPTSPLNVGVERDFNRVDVEGHPPDAIETALAPLEDEAVTAIGQAVPHHAGASVSGLVKQHSYIDVAAIRGQFRHCLALL